MEEYKCEDILHKKQFEMQFIIRFDLVIDCNFYSPFHWHNHIELIYVIEGAMDLFVEGHSLVLQTGQLAVINSEEIHSTRLKGNVKYLLLQVPLSAFSGIDSEIKGYIFKTFFERKKASDVGERLLRMKKTLDKNDSGCRIKFISLMYDLFYTLIKKYRTNDKLPFRKDCPHEGIKRISPIIFYLEKNYKRNIHLSEIASTINVSEEHLCRMLKKYTDTTINKYLMSLGIASVYDELRNTDKKISAILDENGIRNYKGFMRDFKKTFKKNTKTNQKRKIGAEVKTAPLDFH